MQVTLQFIKSIPSGLISSLQRRTGRLRVAKCTQQAREAARAAKPAPLSPHQPPSAYRTHVGTTRVGVRAHLEFQVTSAPKLAGGPRPAINKRGWGEVRAPLGAGAGSPRVGEVWGAVRRGRPASCRSPGRGAACSPPPRERRLVPSRAPGAEGARARQRGRAPRTRAAGPPAAAPGKDGGFPGKPTAAAGLGNAERGVGNPWRAWPPPPPGTARRLVAGDVADPEEVRCGLFCFGLLGGKKKCTRRFPFPPRVPACAPEGGTEEAPGPAGETKAAGTVCPGHAGLPARRLGSPPAGSSPRTPLPASSLSLVPSFRHCCGELQTLDPRAEVKRA